MWREFRHRSIDQVISTGVEEALRRSSGGLHARRKSKVQKSVPWDPRLLFVGVRGSRHAMLASSLYRSSSR
jgi:hypothetical protein